MSVVARGCTMFAVTLSAVQINSSGAYLICEDLQAAESFGREL